MNKSDLPQKLELNEISAKLGAPAVISAKSGENSGEPAKLLEKAVSEKLDLASRNLKNVWVVEPRYADPVSLVHFDSVVVTKAAISKLEEMWG